MGSVHLISLCKLLKTNTVLLHHPWAARRTALHMNKLKPHGQNSGTRPKVPYNNNRIQRRYSRFVAISSQRCELSPTRMLKWPRRNRVQIACNTSSAYHLQMSCYMPLGTKGQFSYSVWQSWNHIYLSFILLAESLNRWRRGGNWSTRRKPLVTSFRKCLILQPEDSSPKQDWNPRSSIGGRLGKQTC